jgi:hypothetical protein
MGYEKHLITIPPITPYRWQAYIPGVSRNTMLKHQVGMIIFQSIIGIVDMVAWTSYQALFSMLVRVC